jgi:type II secretion system protein N
MQILSYFIVSLLFFYFFFLWQFPYFQIKEAIVQGFEEAIPFKLSIGRVGPSLPANLLIENIRLDSGSLLFQFPDIRLHPNLLSFFWGEVGFNLEDLGGSQRLRGEFQSAKKEKHGRMKIWLNNLVIKTSTREDLSFQLKLSGEATLKWVGEDYEKGDGQAWALLERGQMGGVEVTHLPLPLALFDKIRADIQLKEGVLRIKRLEVSGKELRGSFQGDFPFPGKGKGDFPDLRVLLPPPQK